MKYWVIDILFGLFLVSVIIGGFWYMDYGMRKIKEKHSKKI